MNRRLAFTSAFLTLAALPMMAQWQSNAQASDPALSNQSIMADLPPSPEQRPSYAPGYLGVIQKTVSMVRNPQAQQLAEKFGLNIMDVTWEDTGRFKNSAVGPNISDMTIQVQHKNPDDRYSLHLMPVIRHPNYSDKTADIPLDQIYINVGNEKNKKLQKVALEDVLKNSEITCPSHNPGKGVKNLC
ncbi:MAG: hypothetical protein HC810_05550 [Acaryochloridaceae cyanobacterium RL_2_7]|nr:hypothetical protein [Acaryochloridaceae cyanobacterium RL_2_7]